MTPAEQIEVIKMLAGKQKRKEIKGWRDLSGPFGITSVRVITFEGRNMVYSGEELLAMMKAEGRKRKIRNVMPYL